MTDDLPTPPLPELTPITRVGPGPEENGPKPLQPCYLGGRQPQVRCLTMVQLAEEAVAVEAQVIPADAGGAKKPLSGSEFSAVVAAVTSAFGDPTRRQVYLYVRDSASGVTASQVAMRFSLHPNVAAITWTSSQQGGTSRSLAPGRPMSGPAPPAPEGRQSSTARVGRPRSSKPRAGGGAPRIPARRGARTPATTSS